MKEHVNLEASGGHQLDAYVAHPEGGPVAGLVVVQEIFGVNRHIRSVADTTRRTAFWRLHQHCSTATSVAWSFATRARICRKRGRWFPGSIWKMR
jgi:hypothetical protein